MDNLEYEKKNCILGAPILFLAIVTIMIPKNNMFLKRTFIC